MSSGFAHFLQRAAGTLCQLRLAKAVPPVLCDGDGFFLRRLLQKKKRELTHMRSMCVGVAETGELTHMRSMCVGVAETGELTHMQSMCVGVAETRGVGIYLLFWLLAGL